jgi:hypothetical protein
MLFVDERLNTLVCKNSLNHLGHFRGFIEEAENSTSVYICKYCLQVNPFYWLLGFQLQLNSLHLENVEQSESSKA